MKSLTRNWFLGVAGCLILAAGIALAEKGGKGGGKPGGNDGGDKPVALHGCITFADRVGDSVWSDGVGAYCDSIDSSIGLLEFFRFNVELAKDGTGRTLSLSIADVVDPNELPANEEFWTLAIRNVHLDDWRSQALGAAVLRNGKLSFGKEPNDDLVILYGDFDYGTPLTVIRTDDDVWTIESLPLDTAVVARQGKGNANFIPLGSGAVPFKVTYDGTL
jgi:hypothetical protein